jgi:hypothetical protein
VSHFHPETVKDLNQQLANLRNWRTNEECDLAGAETHVRIIKTRIDEITGRIADMEKLLAIVGDGRPADPAMEAFVDAADAEDARLAEENEVEHFGAADAERWGEENAANQCDAEHYNADDGAEDDAPFASLSGEQANGNACRVCGGEFKPGEASEPSGYIIGGGQLFAHSACVESEA